MKKFFITEISIEKTEVFDYDLDAIMDKTRYELDEIFHEDLVKTLAPVVDMVNEADRETIEKEIEIATMLHREISTLPFGVDVNIVTGQLIRTMSRIARIVMTAELKIFVCVFEADLATTTPEQFIAGKRK